MTAPAAPVLPARYQVSARGTDWDVASAAGGDLLIVAGGIGLAPLRGALLAALGQRDAYRRIVVLIGARSPGRADLRPRAGGVAPPRR